MMDVYYDTTQTDSQFNPGQAPGTGCFSLELPCRVPFGSSDVNLTSYLLVSWKNHAIEMI
jgi:hypothetical protein